MSNAHAISSAVEAVAANPTADGTADNPLLDYLGIRLADTSARACTFALDIHERHLNRQRSLQGGVIATLLDAACGYAGLCDSKQGPSGQPVTINLSVNYVDRVSSGGVRATGRVVRAGRSIYFSVGELVADDGRVIAMAHGSFKRSVARN